MDKNSKQNNIVELSEKNHNICSQNKNHINKYLLKKLNLINGEIYSYNINSNATQNNDTNRKKNKKNKSENIKNAAKYKQFIYDSKKKDNKKIDNITFISNNKHSDSKNKNNKHKKMKMKK